MVKKQEMSGVKVRTDGCFSPTVHQIRSEVDKLAGKIAEGDDIKMVAFY